MTAKLEKELEAIKRKLIEKELVTFKVAEYENKKKYNSCFSSPSFYTSPTRYRMQVRVFPNGTKTGKDTHLSLFIHFVEGDHDKTLNWPFVGSITVTVLNQVEDDNHFSRSINCTAGENLRVGRNRGFTKFIPHTEIQDPCTHYLKNDTLYFRVSVDEHNHKPWLYAQITETDYHIIIYIVILCTFLLVMMYIVKRFIYFRVND